MSKHAVLLHVPGELYQKIYAESAGKPWPGNCSVTAWLLQAARERLERLAPVPEVKPEPSIEAHSSMVEKVDLAEYFRLKTQFEAATTEEDRDRLMEALLEIRPEMETRLRTYRKNKPLVFV